MADFVVDSFTDAAGTAITSHVGATGATWTNHPDTVSTSVISDANRARSVSASLHLHYASGVPAGAEYSVSAVMYNVSELAERVGVVGRLKTTASFDGYIAAYRAGNGWQLFRAVAGALTQLGADSGTNENNVVGGSRTLKLNITNAAKELLSDGTLCITNADNTVTAAGRAGLWKNNFNGATNTTGHHWDSFVANEADGGATPNVAEFGPIFQPRRPRVEVVSY